MTDELIVRDDDETTVTGGELPEQGTPQTPTILPGIHLFRLPAALAQCWGSFDVRKKDANGNVMTFPAGTKDAAGADIGGQEMSEQHLMLKLDRDNPLICIDPNGPYDGLPAQANINTMGRKRGKRDDPNAPIVSDMTYFKVKSLGDLTVIAKRKDWIPVINKHAGAVVRLDHGLRATCREDAVRYIPDTADETGQRAVKDATGTMGCGKKYYTNAFRVEGGGFADQVNCECGARLRGFFQIERFLEPQA